MDKDLIGKNYFENFILNFLDLKKVKVLIAPPGTL